ncbi:unnamed protein product [Clonostachys rhizophaga]|uniref:C2H2-type domain-containing protein n=1 Tax=Clonostachys rhizophaga TaxID=160324 RepID=A0A9N9VM56_9HYPO|nr:unnamed protein product [Clonostachys rhizophaga]
MVIQPPVYRRVFFRDTQYSIRLRTIRVFVQRLCCTTISNSISLKCTTLATKKQFLRHRHAVVHSSSRPHYCPHIGCPRGKGGKGFKQKNEMIRHGLIHDSPGYQCPFCPDPAPQYPRPDNLQSYEKSCRKDFPEVVDAGGV